MVNYEEESLFRGVGLSFVVACEGVDVSPWGLVLEGVDDCEEAKLLTPGSKFWGDDV